MLDQIGRVLLSAKLRGPCFPTQGAEGLDLAVSQLHPREALLPKRIIDSSHVRMPFTPESA